MQFTDDFLADLNRFGVPFGAQIGDRYVSTPPVAWARVFNSPPDSQGRPSVGGGITREVAAMMRSSAAVGIRTAAGTPGRNAPGGLPADHTDLPS